MGPLTNHCVIEKKYEQILGGAFLIESSPFENYKNKSRLRIANQIHGEKKRIVNSQHKKINEKGVRGEKIGPYSTEKNSKWKIKNIL